MFCTFITYTPQCRITFIQRGRIVQSEAANQPGGKQGRGRTSQGANKPEGVSARGQISHGQKNQGRTDKGAKKPDTVKITVPDPCKKIKEAVCFSKGLDMIADLICTAAPTRLDNAFAIVMRIF